ncbi:MAG: hypothetical protein ACK5MK_03470 [Dysgonomonas sp.]
MKKQFIILILIPFLFGCPVCNKPTKIVDIGPIPDSLYKLVPYQDSVVYKFVHSNGYVVSFQTSRKTEEESTFDECSCSELRRYYRNSTIMISDYPAITIQLDIVHFDSISSSFGISIRNNYFENWDFIQKVFSKTKPDSTLVNGKYFKDIFVFKNYNSYNNQTLFADSLYYSTDKGIIKIFMTNGESYSIYN